MKKLTTILAGALLAVPMALQAAPRLDIDCPTKIKLPDSGVNYFWNKACDTVYVLPPQSGNLEITGFSASANLDNPKGVCRQVSAVEERINDHIEQVNPYDSIIERTMQRRDQALADGNQDLVDELDIKLIELDKGKREHQRDNYDFETKIYENRDHVLGREGAHTSFILNVNHQKLINQIETLNSGSEVSFRPMLLSGGGYAFSNRAERSTSSFPAISALEFPGISTNSINPKTLPESEIEQIGEDAADSQINKLDNLEQVNKASYENDGLNQSTSMEDIFLSSVSGTAIWNLGAACNINEKAKSSPLGLKDTFNIRGPIAANAVYKYQVLSNYGYSIFFNFTKFHKVVRKSKSRGGFFSKKVYNSVMSELFTNQVLDIKFHAGNDVRAQIPDDEMKRIEDDARDRALKWVLYYESNGKISPASLLKMPTGPNGAQELGSALLKCPHIYCQIGGYGFKILGSIFGRTSTNSTTIDKKDIKVEWKVSKDKPLVFYGGLSFK